MMLTTLLPRLEQRHAVAGAIFGSLLPAACLAVDALLGRPPGESLSAPAATALALMPVFFGVGFYRIGCSKAQLLAELHRRRSTEARLRYDACHDRLTGLANRLCLERDLHALLDAARVDAERRPALLLIDLDRFKHVNDSMGHGAGDGLLAAIAARLLAALTPAARVYRLGGDEFVVTVDGNPSVGKVEDVCRTICTLFDHPFALANGRVSSGCSIGATFLEPSDTAMPDLLERADLALYAAKDAPGNSFRFFDRALAEAASRREGTGCEPVYLRPRLSA